MMHTIPFLTVKEGGEPRPFVPLVLRYRCRPCKAERAHEHTLPALADSGAERAVLPGALLPEHVAWADLPATTARLSRAGLGELRVWHADLSVLGVRIAREVLIAEPGGWPEYAVLGLGDLFAHFTVAFAAANQPPFLSLQANGQRTPVRPAVTGYALEGANGHPDQTLVAIASNGPVEMRPALPAPNRAARRLAMRAGRSRG